MPPIPTLAFPLQLSLKGEPQWPSLPMGGPHKDTSNTSRCVWPSMHGKKGKSCALILVYTLILPSCALDEQAGQWTGHGVFQESQVKATAAGQVEWRMHSPTPSLISNASRSNKDNTLPLWLVCQKR